MFFLIKGDPAADLASCLFRLKRRNGGEELAGIFVLRIVDNIGYGTGFNDFTVIHNRHTVAYISDHGEVVTDKEKSQIVRGAQLLEQFGNFGLNRYIQC